MAAAALIAACAVIAGSISLDRQYFNVDTETDFLGSFMPDAERFARGQPLLVQYHPPGYPVILALTNGMVGDWMNSGLLVSWISMLGVLLASYGLFRRIGGEWAAAGSIIGLATSPLFLAYGAQSTSDMPFLALWMTSLALTAGALDAGARWRWVAAGVVAGFTILTRTNGIVLAPIVVAPFLTRREWRSRIADALAATAGLAVPICAWAAFAFATGSPLTPTDTYVNLALAYGEGHLSGDTLQLMKGRFTSVREVITHDPLRIIEVYATDLVQLPKRILTQTTWLPLGVLGAVTLPLWLVRITDSRVLFVLLTTLASVLLINLHPFEPRFYLLLLPLLGASLTTAISRWLDRPSRSRWVPIAAAGVIALVAAAGLLQAAPRARAKAEAPDVRAQLAEAVPAVRRHTPSEAVLVARKHNVAFHAQRRSANLPLVATIDELCRPMQAHSSNGPAYIYIGYAERRRHRVELSRELLKDELPAWLTVAAQGPAGDGWRLLAVKPGACGN
jgi:hypothetical protein